MRVLKKNIIFLFLCKTSQMIECFKKRVIEEEFDFILGFDLMIQEVYDFSLKLSVFLQVAL